jgi:hypothetical protein
VSLADGPAAGDTGMRGASSRAGGLLFSLLRLVFTDGLALVFNLSRWFASPELFFAVRHTRPPQGLMVL